MIFGCIATVNTLNRSNVQLYPKNQIISSDLRIPIRVPANTGTVTTTLRRMTVVPKGEYFRLDIHHQRRS
jgi:hypothetical protein